MSKERLSSVYAEATIGCSQASYALIRREDHFVWVLTAGEEMFFGCEISAKAPERAIWALSNTLNKGRTGDLKVSRVFSPGDKVRRYEVSNQIRVPIEAEVLKVLELALYVRDDMGHEMIWGLGGVEFHPQQ
jgi:hypothetical protein